MDGVCTFTMDARPLESSSLETQEVFTQGRTLARCNQYKEGIFIDSQISHSILPIKDLDRISFPFNEID